MKRAYWLTGIAAIAGALAYVGITQKSWLMRTMGLKKTAAQTLAQNQVEDVDGKLSPQEKLANSIARQQALSHQANQAASMSANEVQRNLKTIEDINRMNRINQQLQQPKP